MANHLTPAEEIADNVIQDNYPDESSGELGFANEALNEALQDGIVDADGVRAMIIRAVELSRR